MARLSREDRRRLAELHGECLPGSRVARLGRAYMRVFYGYVDRSPLEELFVTRQGGRIASACVLSLRPATLSRRLALHTPLLLWAPVALFRLPILPRILGAFRRREARTAGPPREGLPEILLVFTAPEARGRGAASALLARCESSLAQRGHRRYTVRTEDREENRALGFYARNGFVDQGRTLENGEPFRILVKTIGGPPAGAGSQPVPC